MTTHTASPTVTATEFEALLYDIRPELHRYATRMTGSVIDGEDVVQDALIKAYASISLLPHQTNIRGWLFKITHNKAIDHLRRYSNESLELLDEYPITEEPDMPLEAKEIATLALSVFLKLVPRQRSCVILKDVMGYSLAEISALLNATVPEIKATLHRGRTRLRELAKSVEGSTPELDEHERALLDRYVDRFNARDFDAVRDMLAGEVELDLIGQAKLRGVAEVSTIYFHNYRHKDDWQFVLGLVEDRFGILVYDPHEARPEPAYFVLITWADTQVSRIRDYRYARYVMRDTIVTST